MLTFLIIAALVFFLWRTHKRRNQIKSGGVVNDLAWKAAHRSRFRLGPRSWRLKRDENTL
jgi:hypothetical protein